MKRMILSLLSIALLGSASFSQDAYEPATPSSSSSSKSIHKGISFGGAGAGIQVGLVVAEKWNSYLPAAAFGFGAQGIVEIDFGKVGKAQYLPSLAFWFRNDKDHPDFWWNGVWIEEAKVKDGMIAINFLDLKYLPPLKASIPVRPYIGLGPAIVIHTGGYNYVHFDEPNVPGDQYYKDEDSWSDADAAFNFFVGVDFKATPVIAPFVEARYTASDKRVFRLTGGLNVLF